MFPRLGLRIRPPGDFQAAVQQIKALIGYSPQERVAVASERICILGRLRRIPRMRCTFHTFTFAAHLTILGFLLRAL